MRVEVLILLTLSSCDAARILAILPCPSRSHHIWNHVLLESLSTRGHHVVSLSPFLEPDTPNLKHFQLENIIDNSSKIKTTLLDRANFTAQQHVDAFFQCCFDMCKNMLHSEGSKQILKMKNNFDLLIIESFGFECMFGFVYYFGIPTVAVSAHGYTPWNNQQMGVPDQLAVLPLEAFPYSTPMSWIQRAYNTLITTYMQVRRSLDYLPHHEENAREIFGAEMPSLALIERNFSIFLVNSGPEFDPPRPRPPAVIDVGCLHCRPGKSLTKDIKYFLDVAKEGVIYFSLGSNVRGDQMSAEKLQAFLTVFAELKQKVLWKWDLDDMPGKPDNVLIVKWLAQQDVLAHKNVRLFMTHGGRLSTQESVYHGTPILVIPVFYDQYLHAHRAIQLGLGLRLDFNNATEQALRQALHSLLHNPRFLKNAVRQSNLSRDQPESPLDRAVFWTEYVLRHEGARHLRSAVLDLSWYQVCLLDIVIVSLIVVFTTTLTCIKLVKRCRYQRKSKKD